MRAFGKTQVVGQVEYFLAAQQLVASEHSRYRPLRFDVGELAGRALSCLHDFFYGTHYFTSFNVVLI